jgi:5-methyltetrahydrofolate--homocysteine methyltransferase
MDFEVGRVYEYLTRIFSERVVILDGGMGTMIQTYRPTEETYRGDRFADHPQDLINNNDLLCITQPSMIYTIHRQYLEAGADIIETNTFNGTKIAQADFRAEHLVREINLEAARIARRAADDVTALEPDKWRLVAGAIGPTSKTASVSRNVEDPSQRDITFDELVESYYEEICALHEGGVHLILIETIFDTLNSKAALYAYEQYFSDKPKLPLMLSGTLVDLSGRTLSGQTIEAFLTSVMHSKPMCIGMNCALGAEHMKPFLTNLSDIAPLNVHAYPNAGLPNAMGGYDEDPEQFATNVMGFIRSRLLNMVGGCCGTTPAHIAALVRKIEQERIPPRQIPKPLNKMMLSGLKEFIFYDNIPFVNIGERCNLSGSIRFHRLMVKEKNYDAALEVAREQVNNGAQVLDINVDDGMIDSVAVMEKFLKLLTSDPEISTLPIMIDSSNFKVIEAGLKVVQGKCIVNSISLKNGEEEFLREAEFLRKFGAAAVIMAFDEEGQATEIDQKVKICDRVYNLLTEKLKFPPEDIIFDLNILTIATGMEEHNPYAKNFIEATKIVRTKYPKCHVSGGLSNLSFSFRGLTDLREAMHSVFLYHAIKAGMDMGIVNAGALPIYEDIEPELRKLLEEVIFNESEDGRHVERIVEYAEKQRQKSSTKSGEKPQEAEWRSFPIDKRFEYCLVKGLPDNLEVDLQEALKAYPSPLHIIEGPLMSGMSVVGDLFGSGKMFLPQVIKSARVMKKAIGFLEPLMESAGTSGSNGTILMATVKGDVHDIGKNIVGVVLKCNNYKVIDLGVQVPWDVILKTIKDENVDVVGLSGLITPSLDHMVNNAKQMGANGLKLPLLIGGATTSKMHTAVKIEPCYTGPVVHVLDASRSAPVVSALLDPNLRDSYMQEIREEYEQLRNDYYASQSEKKFKTLQDARNNKFIIDWSSYKPVTPKKLGVTVIEDQNLSELIPYIDWNPFFVVWQIRGRYPNRSYPRIFNDKNVGEQAKTLFDEAQAMLQEIIRNKSLKAKGVFGLFEAKGTGDDIEVYKNEDKFKFYTLRQQEVLAIDGPSLALSDFVSPNKDYFGAFAVTAGLGCDDLAREYENDGDDYKSIMLKALADRLVEAFAEFLHEKVRTDYWGYASESFSKEDLIHEKYQGIRPAPGYPSQPDHLEKLTLWKLLNVEEKTGMTLTDSLAMHPAASVSGLYISHPQGRYFNLGQVCDDQVQDYAGRKGLTPEEVRKWI